jgi:hypothetical protein
MPDGRQLRIQHADFGWIISLSDGIEHFRPKLRDALADVSGGDRNAGWLVRLEEQLERDLQTQAHMQRRLY